MTMRERIATGQLFTDYCEGLPEDRMQQYHRGRQCGDEGYPGQFRCRPQSLPGFTDYRGT
jgi:hypothetical protein